ncbi:DUF2127 domain-containing protein [Nostoc sp. 'Peltigera malacea cyanobiont' DB3992]|uniref:DUF2127 domain-containing protein n=1 Tax=Nostoc sp. 'Peltigera malacea cyanobiont' DB3992 TaxID=1206980 RepID=UPI0026D0D535|nr:DUF2127 domain-containing protein [Nostoc sp. 'Peltigera malacea cyanobiont' DB3992]
MFEKASIGISGNCSLQIIYRLAADGYFDRFIIDIKNYQNLEVFSENYVLEGKSIIIDWLLNKVLNLNPRTLAFSGIGAGVYAIVTSIEAVGLWYEKRWAHVLVLGLVGISIPPEIYELIRGFSPIKILILLLNLAVFGYLLRNFPKHPK